MRNLIFPPQLELNKPFTEVKNGYGYYGLLMQEKDTGKLQCHICGGVNHYLYLHIRGAHKMSAHDYKETYGLLQKTALISEYAREEKIKIYNENQEIVDRGRTPFTKGQTTSYERKPRAEELYNKHNTCALQLLQKVETIAKEKGRIPRTTELIHNGESFRGTVVNRFGSYEEVRKILRLNGYADEKEHGNGKKIPREVLLESIKSFYKMYGTEPMSSDLKRGLLYNFGPYKREFGSFVEAKKQALRNETISN